MKNGIVLRWIGVLIICCCACSDKEEEPTSAFCHEMVIVNNNTFKNRIGDDGTGANFFAISNVAVKKRLFGNHYGFRALRWYHYRNGCGRRKTYFRIWGGAKLFENMHSEQALCNAIVFKTMSFDLTRSSRFKR